MQLLPPLAVHLFRVLGTQVSSLPPKTYLHLTDARPSLFPGHPSIICLEVNHPTSSAAALSCLCLSCQLPLASLLTSGVSPTIPAISTSCAAIGEQSFRTGGTCYAPLYRKSPRLGNANCFTSPDTHRPNHAKASTSRQVPGTRIRSGGNIPVLPPGLARGRGTGAQLRVSPL